MNRIKNTLKSWKFWGFLMVILFAVTMTMFVGRVGAALTRWVLGAVTFTLVWVTVGLRSHRPAATAQQPNQLAAATPAQAAAAQPNAAATPAQPVAAATVAQQARTAFITQAQRDEHRATAHLIQQLLAESVSTIRNDDREAELQQRELEIALAMHEQLEHLRH